MEVASPSWPAGSWPACACRSSSNRAPGRSPAAIAPAAPGREAPVAGPLAPDPYPDPAGPGRGRHPRRPVPRPSPHDPEVVERRVARRVGRPPARHQRRQGEAVRRAAGAAVRSPPGPVRRRRAVDRAEGRRLRCPVATRSGIGSSRLPFGSPDRQDKLVLPRLPADEIRTRAD
jgi:hypothetical protein